MKYIMVVVHLFISLLAYSQQHSDPKEVLAWLKAGNDSFVQGKFHVIGVDSSLRISLSNAQHPKAIVLACSDSRVCPELIFDKGLGDLFVIRVAGNIVDDAVIGSIEYAVEHLHTSLVVVMGHQNCGAVAAAVEDLEKHENGITNHIRILTDKIQQAMISVNYSDKDTVKKALMCNILFSLSTLTQSRPVLSEAVKKGDISVVGAVYDLYTGKVEWLKSSK
jgi:carbonic anhydrase